MMEEATGARDSSAALIGEIEAQCAAEIEVVTRTAEREAAAIVARAFTVARRRAHEAIEGMRREAERRLARAGAQIETECRLRDQARAAEILHTGCPSLINAIVERWQDPEARRRWIGAVCDHARLRLRPGDWVVEHPHDWDGANEAQARALLAGGGGPEPGFREAGDFEAGLRILAGGIVLDGTPERLLADKAATQARLLAEMDAAQAGGDRGERP